MCKMAAESRMVLGMQARRPTEREIIAKIRRAVNPGLRNATRGTRGVKPGSGVRLGIGDDCAILRAPRGHEVLVTTDLSLEGRHFRREWHPADAVGHRTLARGLSDLAAMGAKPLAAFLSMAMPGAVAGSDWLDEFMRGFLTLAKAAGVTLAGGDTAEFAGGVVADIVLLGTAPAGTALQRSGARAGDGIYVTGALGGSAAELRAAPYPGLRNETRGTHIGGDHPRGTHIHPDSELHPHLYPEPRLAAGMALRRRGLATACIDVSDGISTDLTHLCAESGCGAVIEAAKIPVHRLAAGRADALELALHGGEDYELLFTARGAVPRSISGVKITRIGTMTAGRAVKIKGWDGKTKRLAAQGWEHFAG